jgi:hypothetical protein
MRPSEKKPPGVIVVGSTRNSSDDEAVLRVRQPRPIALKLIRLPAVSGMLISAPLERTVSCTPVKFPLASDVKLPDILTGPSASKPVITNVYGVPVWRWLPAPTTQVGSRPLLARVMILELPARAGAGNIASAGIGLWLSVTRTAKENDAELVGVPAMTPFGLRVIPGGSGPLPFATLHL